MSLWFESQESKRKDQSIHGTHEKNTYVPVLTRMLKIPCFFFPFLDIFHHWIHLLILTSI